MYKIWFSLESRDLFTTRIAEMKSPEDLIPIGDLSVVQTTALLDHLKFEHFAPVLASKGVNGAVLEDIESPNEFEELGVDQTTVRRALFRKIQDAKEAGGVSRGILESKVCLFLYILRVVSPPQNLRNRSWCCADLFLNAALLHSW